MWLGERRGRLGREREAPGARVGVFGGLFGANAGIPGVIRRYCCVFGAKC